MKSIIKVLFAIVLVSGIAIQVSAQRNAGELQVNTRLRESEGTYDQRQLYRKFLEEYMKNCPYITNFSVREVVGTSDNHDVEWRYNVNSWDDITKFYSWVAQQLKSPKESGLKMALAPFAPDYAIGGQISVAKRMKSSLARH